MLHQLHILDGQLNRGLVFVPEPRKPSHDAHHLRCGGRCGGRYGSRVKFWSQAQAVLRGQDISCRPVPTIVTPLNHATQTRAMGGERPLVEYFQLYLDDQATRH